MVYSITNIEDYICKRIQKSGQRAGLLSQKISQDLWSQLQANALEQAAMIALVIASHNIAPKR